MTAQEKEAGGGSNQSLLGLKSHCFSAEREEKASKFTHSLWDNEEKPWRKSLQKISAAPR